MSLKKFKSTRWTKKQVAKNLKASKCINCEEYIHEADKKALSVLKSIPLLDKLCSKILSVLGDTPKNMIDMSSKIHITDKQLPKIHTMVKSICNKIRIDMPELYLELDRSNPNAYAYGYDKKYTIVITSALLECLEDDEIYAVLAHECGHIACKHGLYHTIATLLLVGGYGLEDLISTFSKGIIGNIIGGVASVFDGALELAFYHWNRCSEFSADRVAAICCGSSAPVIKTMARLAGGTTRIGSEIDIDQFVKQASEYQLLTDGSKLNKAMEFWFTKNDTHPLLAVRAAEIKKFAESEAFQKI